MWWAVTSKVMGVTLSEAKALNAALRCFAPVKIALFGRALYPRLKPGVESSSTPG